LFDFSLQVCYNRRLVAGEKGALSMLVLAGRSQLDRRNTLANLKSSIKRIRSSRRKAVYNQITRSTARTYIKKARQLIEDGNLEEAQTVVQLAVQALDKAAQKGVIHHNNASRRKSRLVRALNQAMNA
jgi:small subunit ribosomal protein S20